MSRVLYLTLLTIFTLLVPGIRCLYRRRWWSAALFLAATLSVFIAALSVHQGQALASVKVLIFSVVLVLGAHFTLLSATLAASAERHKRSRAAQEALQYAYSEPMPAAMPSRASPRLAVKESSELLAEAHP